MHSISPEIQISKEPKWIKIDTKLKIVIGFYWKPQVYHLTNKLILRFHRKESRLLRKSWKIVEVSENERLYKVLISQWKVIQGINIISCHIMPLLTMCVYQVDSGRNESFQKKKSKDFTENRLMVQVAKPHRLERGNTSKVFSHLIRKESINIIIYIWNKQKTMPGLARKRNI